MKKIRPKLRMKKTIGYRFSEKHKEYIRRCRECVYNVAEGAVRAGKTVDNVLAFCEELKHTPDKLHLATASTAPTAKLIIGDCNGFGIEHFFVVNADGDSTKAMRHLSFAESTLIIRQR